MVTAVCIFSTVIQHSIISDNNTHPTWDILPAKRHLSSDGHCSVSVRDLEGLIPYGGVYPHKDGTGQGHASSPPWCSQCSTRRLQLFLSTRRQFIATLILTLVVNNTNHAS